MQKSLVTPIGRERDAKDSESRSFRPIHRLVSLLPDAYATGRYVDGFVAQSGDDRTCGTTFKAIRKAQTGPWLAIRWPPSKGPTCRRFTSMARPLSFAALDESIPPA